MDFPALVVKHAEATVRKVIVAALILVALMTHPVRVDAAAGDVLLEVMASPEGFAAGASLGHAFMCIELLLNSGIKEDCYGFYPKSNKISAFIGGPGVVNDEFRKNPLRFSVIASSFKRVISEDMRRKLLHAADQFNGSKYELTDSNCIDFIDKIAQIAGWKTPDRRSFQRPVDYVNALAQSNP